MFQSFEEISSPGAVPERVRALRRELKSRKLKGFLVPHSDEHQDEFLPPCAERLRWLTGFTGSAGAAIVLENAAALFVDGRYTLQARAQTDTSLFDVLQTPEAKASKWLAAARRRAGPSATTRTLHTIKEIERLTESLGKVGIRLQPQADNPIDLLWHDRPAPSSAPVVPHGPELAGRSASEKIAEVQETLKREKADAVLLTLLDSIAWLFNIRGGDITHSPLALAFALVPARGKPALFIDPAKLGDNVRGHLKETAELLPPDALDTRLKALGRGAPASASILRRRRCVSRTSLKPQVPRSPPETIPAFCPRRSRTRPRSTAPAPRISATEQRSSASSPGSTRIPPRAGSMRSARR